MVSFADSHGLSIGQGIAHSDIAWRFMWNVGVPCHTGSISIIMFAEERSQRESAVHFAKIQRMSLVRRYGTIYGAYHLVTSDITPYIYRKTMLEFSLYSCLSIVISFWQFLVFLTPSRVNCAATQAGCASKERQKSSRLLMSPGSRCCYGRNLSLCNVSQTVILGIWRRSWILWALTRGLHCAVSVFSAGDDKFGNEPLPRNCWWILLNVRLSGILRCENRRHKTRVQN